MSVEIGPVERRVLIFRRLGVVFLILGLILLCIPLVPLEVLVSPLMKWVTGESQPETVRVLKGLSSGALASFYIGAVAPLWSLSVLMFIYAALLGQRIQLIAHRESFEILKAQVDDQREIFSRQARQARGQNLFEMMRWHNEMVNTFRMTRGHGENARTLLGKECLKAKYREFIDDGYRRLFKDDEQFRALYEAEIESVKRTLDEQETEAVRGAALLDKAVGYHGTEGEVAREEATLKGSAFGQGGRESRWELIEGMRDEAFNRALDEYFQESGREKEYIRKMYLEFYDGNKDMLGNYFQSLRDMLKYIESSGLPEELFYVNMLKMQLCGEELALLFYHVQAMGRDELRALVERYDMLEHLTYGLLHPRYQRLLGLSVRQR